MSLAQRFERRLEGLVGGAFARVFKGQVEPVEIGTALQREAADRKNIMGNGQVLCPNRYRVTLAAVRLRPARAVGGPAHQRARRARPGAPGREPVDDHRRHRGLPGPRRRAAHRRVRRRVADGVRRPAAPPPARLAVDAGLPGQRPAATPPGGTATAARPPPHHRTPPQPPAASRSRTPPPYQPPPPPAASPPPRGRSSSTRPTSASNCATAATSIGRGSESDLQLLDQGVSRRHVDIQYDGRRATVYDLGSTNGTTVNGHEVGSHMLRHGDVVRVGHTRMVFQQEQA